MIATMPRTDEPKQLLRLAALAAVVGLLAGAAAWALVHLIAFITNAALFHRYGWDLPNFSELDVSPLVVLTAVVGVIFFVPLPMRVWAPFELRPHEAASIYVEAPGRLENLAHGHGRVSA